MQSAWYVREIMTSGHALHLLISTGGTVFMALLSPRLPVTSYAGIDGRPN
jgi:hypothetical protein